MKSFLLIGLGRFGRYVAQKLQELHHQLGQRGAEQYIPQYAQPIAEVSAKIKELGAKYSREQVLLKGFKPGVVCPTCRRAVSVEELDVVLSEIRKSLSAIATEGKAQKSRLNELQAQEMNAEEAFQRNKSSDLARIDQEDLEDLHSRIQSMTADIEYGNLSQAEYDRLAECREQLRICRAEMEAAEKMVQTRPEEYDMKIAETERLIRDKKRLLSDVILYVGKRAELTFSQLKMNLVEIALSEVVKSTGEVRDVFKFTYGGRYYNRLSLSEKIRAGLEVSELVKRLTGRNYPVFIDNMESVDELTNIRPSGQIIMAKCVRGTALAVKPMGRIQAAEQAA